MYCALLHSQPFQGPTSFLGLITGTVIHRIPRLAIPPRQRGWFLVVHGITSKAPAPSEKGADRNKKNHGPPGTGHGLAASDCKAREVHALPPVNAPYSLSFMLRWTFPKSMQSHPQASCHAPLRQALCCRTLLLYMPQHGTRGLQPCPPQQIEIGTGFLRKQTPPQEKAGQRSLAATCSAKASLALKRVFPFQRPPTGGQALSWPARPIVSCPTQPPQFYLQRSQHAIRWRGEDDRGWHSHPPAFRYLWNVLEAVDENRLSGPHDRQRRLAHPASRLPRPAHNHLPRSHGGSSSKTGG